MKLVHKSLTPYISILCAVLTALSLPVAAQSSNAAAYSAFYNPVKGFKPAQTNLTAVFLQIAGSLECHGSPAQYIRHLQAEELRVAAKYKASTGRTLKSHRPAYMTDEYIDTLIANWELLSPKLHLDDLAKKAGLCAREAIRGTRDNGTILVGMFNDHQDQVSSAMAGDRTAAGFEELRAKLATELEFNNSDVSTNGYETARRDAVSYALVFRGVRTDLFATLDSSLAAAKAAQLKAIVDSVFIDLGYMAQTELELGILEKALK